LNARRADIPRRGRPASRKVPPHRGDPACAGVIRRESARSPHQARAGRNRSASRTGSGGGERWSRGHAGTTKMRRCTVVRMPARGFLPRGLSDACPPSAPHCQVTGRRLITLNECGHSERTERSDPRRHLPRISAPLKQSNSMAPAIVVKFLTSFGVTFSALDHGTPGAIAHGRQPGRGALHDRTRAASPSRSSRERAEIPLLLDHTRVDETGCLKLLHHAFVFLT